MKKIYASFKKDENVQMALIIGTVFLITGIGTLCAIIFG